MKERIVEILMLVMSEIQSRKGLADIDLGDLRNQGYSQSEISAALSWLYDNLKVHETAGISLEDRPGGNSRRVLHDVEKQMLSVEAQGYLIQLRELGLVDGHDLEVILEKVVLTGFEKLSPTELQEIVGLVLLTKQGSAWETNRSGLYNRDTIH